MLTAGPTRRASGWPRHVRWLPARRPTPPRSPGLASRCTRRASPPPGCTWTRSVPVWRTCWTTSPLGCAAPAPTPAPRTWRSSPTGRWWACSPPPATTRADRSRPAGELRMSLDEPTTGVASGPGARPHLPFGSWPAPITAADLAAGSRSLGEIQLDGADTYWTESDPAAGGRTVLVHRDAEGSLDRVTWTGSDGARVPVTVRTRVNEYGGGRSEERRVGKEGRAGGRRDYRTQGAQRGRRRTSGTA